MSQTKAVQDVTPETNLHPKTDADAFDRWLLYRVADRLGILPEGFVVGDNPNDVNQVASNEARQAETPEQVAASNKEAFEAAVAAAVKKAQDEAKVDAKDTDAKASKSGKGDA